MRRDLTREKAEAAKMYEDNPSITPHEMAKIFKVSDVTAYKWRKEFDQNGHKRQKKIMPTTRIPSADKPLDQVTLRELVEAFFAKYLELTEELKIEREKAQRMQKIIDDLERSIRTSPSSEGNQKILSDFREVLGMKK